jgi:2-methylcitrate dehydratase PrpD
MVFLLEPLMPTVRPSRRAEVSGVMSKLAAYMAGASSRALPPDVVEKTKHHILDTLAAMASGAQLPPGRLAVSFAAGQGGTREATVVGTRVVTSAITAALANGMTAHADETDDSHQPGFYHPGCAIVPAALAVAEREGSSGRSLLRAVALGYDVGSRFNLALGAMRFHLAGHSTHSFGALFGAAAAAGAVARLRADGMRHLLSYTAQQASGVSCWMRDAAHVEKAFDFGGMPARNGVTAALMVAHGMTAVDDVLSGERNFLFAFGAESEADRLVDGLGTRHEILNANIKKWSVGSPIQAALDSVQELMRGQRLSADTLERMVIEIQDHEAAIVNNRSMPDICLQHLVAVLLLDGALTFTSSHDVKRMTDPKVRAVRQRIELNGSAELTAEGGRQAIVTAHLTDASRLRHHTAAVKGTPANPMRREDVEEKSLDLLVPVLGPLRARQLVETVWHLERLSDVRRLRSQLQPPQVGGRATAASRRRANRPRRGTLVAAALR